MTFEQQYFIQLLRNYVHQENSEEPATRIDWNRIAAYAIEQNVSGIIYYQTRSLERLPDHAVRKLKEGFFSDVYLSVNTDYAYKKAASLFDQKRIEYLPFKGALIRNYYPHPELRTMGDRDILIHHADRETSNEAMLSLGYQKYVDNHAVWTYFKKNLMFEIHDVMFYENLANQVDYRDYFSHIWETASARSENASSLERIPDINMHFVYSMAHTAKHVINKGMGFRAFLDMVFFAQNAKEADWDLIRTELEKLSLLDFTENCFYLCEEWFEIKMPFSTEKKDLAWARQMTEKIFRDGIFGLENEDNAASKSAKEIRRSEKAYGLTALRLTLHSLFPPYEDMQLIPWYSWVDGKPWLMPAAWVYRWFYCLKNKRRASRDLLFEPYEKKETIEARQEYLDRWGL